MNEALVPISIYITFAFVVYELIGLAKTISVNRTLRKAMDKGEEVPWSKIIEDRSELRRRPDGLVLISLSFGLFAAGVVAGGDVRQVFIVIAICAFVTGGTIYASSRLFVRS